MCQSPGVPSTAEYWHIGAMTMRLARPSGPICSGSNRWLMALPGEVGGGRKIAEPLRGQNGPSPTSTQPHDASCLLRAHRPGPRGASARRSARAHARAGRVARAAALVRRQPVGREVPRRGRSTQLAFPRIVPHSDGMGVVDAVGEGVPAGRVGERVWVWNGAGARPRHRGAGHRAAAGAGRAAARRHAGRGGAVWASGADRAARGADGRRRGRPRTCWWPAAPARSGTSGAVCAPARRAPRAGHRQHGGQGRRSPRRRRRRRRRLPPARRRRAVADAAGGAGVERIVELDIAANAALDIELLKAGGQLVVYGSGQAAFLLPFFPMILKNLSLHAFIVYNLNPAPPARRGHAAGVSGAWQPAAPHRRARAAGGHRAGARTCRTGPGPGQCGAGDTVTRALEQRA